VGRGSCPTVQDQNDAEFNCKYTDLAAGLPDGIPRARLPLLRAAEPVLSQRNQRTRRTPRLITPAGQGNPRPPADLRTDRVLQRALDTFIDDVRIPPRDSEFFTLGSLTRGT
jgi:hypothetical protein